jgi:hypothetical protein
VFGMAKAVPKREEAMGTREDMAGPEVEVGSEVGGEGGR